MVKNDSAEKCTTQAISSFVFDEIIKQTNENKTKQTKQNKKDKFWSLEFHSFEPIVGLINVFIQAMFVV